MSTLNFTQFSWGRLGEFYWDRYNPKFSYVFQLPKEQWCSEVYKVLDNVRGAYKMYNINRWKELVAESDEVIDGLTTKYARTCNDYCE